MNAHTDLFHDVAAHLTTRGPWSVQPAEHDNVVIKSEDGPSLWIRGPGTYGSDKGKFSIHVNYPKDHTGREVYPYMNEPRATSINVAATKTAKQIAGDIERRLLPVYLSIWDTQLARVNDANTYEVNRQASIDRLVKATGGKVTRNEHDKTKVHLDWISRPAFNTKGYVTNVQVSDKTVQLEVRSVPIDVAIKILNLVHGREG
jgi:hypothetical protein